MIGKIRGIVAEIDSNIALVDTQGGVSYLIYVTPYFVQQHSIGATVEVYTHLQIRDDAHVLFGFQNKKQRQYFELLLGISGVGPKTAFSIISYSSEDELIKAVRDNDIAYFSRVPGLGKKTAMKIILEISQKLKSEFQMEKMYLSEEDKTVVDALVSLGFRTQEAKNIFTKIPAALSIEEKIREGIKLGSSPKK